MQKGSQMFSIGDRFWLSFYSRINTIVRVTKKYIMYRPDGDHNIYSVPITTMEMYDRNGELHVKRFKRSIDMDVVADL